MFFDSHAHYDDEVYNIDRYVILREVNKDGVDYILNASCNMASCVESITLAQKLDFVYAAVGIHPYNTASLNNNIMATIAEFASRPKVVAIGEIGLDYHHGNVSRSLQKHWFEKQLKLAGDLKLPVIIHDREAHEDIMDILRQKEYKDIKGLFHSFSGSVEMAKELLDRDFYISVSGVVTFKNSRRVVEVVGIIRDDRLLIETDCPYLAPEPFRGKRNHSGYMKYTAERIANIKGVSIEDIAKTTAANAKRLFAIS